MLTLTSAAAATVVAGLRGAAAQVSPPASLYGPYPSSAISGAPAAGQTLTIEMVREAVAMLQRDGVPPHEDGFYRLYQQGRDYKLSTTGVLETEAARKVRRFNERTTSRKRRTSWRRRALNGMMRLLNRAGRLGVYRA